MASRYKRTMDSIKLILVFWTSLVFAEAPAAWAQTIRLNMPVSGDKSLTQDCPQLIREYLKELRNVIPDTPITIDLPSSANSNENTEVFFLLCHPEPEQRSIELKPEDNANPHYHFRYTKRAQGFEAIDWLQFQRRHQPAISLAPTAKDTTMSKSYGSTQNEPEIRPFYKKIWFWSLVGSAVGLAAGTYIYAQAQSQSRLNVEIR